MRPRSGRTSIIAWVSVRNSSPVLNGTYDRDQDYVVDLKSSDMELIDDYPRDWPKKAWFFKGSVRVSTCQSMTIPAILLAHSQVMDVTG